MVKLALVSEYFLLFDAFTTQAGLPICKPTKALWYQLIFKGL